MQGHDRTREGLRLRHERGAAHAGGDCHEEADVGTPARLFEVAPGYGTTGLSGGAGCSVMVDGADNEENQTEVRCRREGEDSA